MSGRNEKNPGKKERRGEQARNIKHVGRFASLASLLQPEFFEKRR